MVLVIQVSLVLLAFLIFWCEQTKFFADTAKSVLTRFVCATSLIGICYHVPNLSLIHYAYQFGIMVLVILLTLVTFLLTLKRYQYNKSRHYELMMKKEIHVNG